MLQKKIIIVDTLQLIWTHLIHLWHSQKGVGKKNEIGMESADFPFFMNYNTQTPSPTPSDKKKKKLVLQISLIKLSTPQICFRLINPGL